MLRNAFTTVTLTLALAASGCGIDDEYREINRISASITDDLNAAESPAARKRIWKKRKGELADAYEALRDAKNFLSVGMDEETNKELNRIEPELRDLVDDIAPGDYDTVTK